MAYIGKSIESGTFSVLDTSGNTYNGSNTTFSLGTQVGSPAQLLVSHDGVIQKPGTDYSLASGGTQITFSTAPASGASIFIVEISGAVGGPLDSDLNGTELILDTDGDTSITADTDDQIDIKIGGADDFAFKANKFEVQTGSNVDMNGTELILDADADSSITADTDDQIDVKIGGTDQFSIKDGVIEPTTDNDVDIGASSKEFKDGYFDGTLHCDVLDLAGTEYTSISGGLVPITTVAFSSGTQLIINDCFSSTYLNYMMIISLLVPQSDASLNFRFNVGGTVDSTSNYRYTLEGMQNGGSGTSNYSNGSTDEGRLFYDIDADSEAGASGVFYIHNPYGGYQRKQIHGNTILQKGTAANTSHYQVATDYHNSTTKNFTGITLFSSGATNWRAGDTSGGYGRVSIFGIVNS